MNTQPRSCAVVSVLIVFVVMIAAGGLKAHALEPAKGQPILRVSGLITKFNAGDRAEFDLEMLEAMKTISFATKTPWFGKTVTFEGVLVREILSAVGSTGNELVVVALNDYRSTIPMGDFETYDVILAYKRDGVFMKIRDKGPLFVVYPYDSDADLRRQKYYSRSVWQVAEFIVR